MAPLIAVEQDKIYILTNIDKKTIEFYIQKALEEQRILATESAKIKADIENSSISNEEKQELSDSVAIIDRIINEMVKKYEEKFKLNDNKTLSEKLPGINKEYKEKIYRIKFEFDQIINNLKEEENNERIKQYSEKPDTFFKKIDKIKVKITNDQIKVNLETIKQNYIDNVINKLKDGLKPVYVQKQKNILEKKRIDLSVPIWIQELKKSQQVVQKLFNIDDLKSVKKSESTGVQKGGLPNRTQLKNYLYKYNKEIDKRYTKILSIIEKNSPNKLDLKEIITNIYNYEKELVQKMIDLNLDPTLFLNGSNFYDLTIDNNKLEQLYEINEKYEDPINTYMRLSFKDSIIVLSPSLNKGTRKEYLTKICNDITDKNNIDNTIVGQVRGEFPKMRNKNVTKRASPEERVKQEEIKQKKEEETDAKRIEREEYEQIAEKRKLYDELGLTKMTEDINNLNKLISKTRLGDEEYESKLKQLKTIKKIIDDMYNYASEFKSAEPDEIFKEFYKDMDAVKRQILNLNAQLFKKGGKKTRKNLSFQKQNIRL